MSRCPSCGTEEAYVGIISVECINTSCAHYSKKQKDDVAAIKKASVNVSSSVVTASSGSHSGNVKISYRYFDDYDSDTMDAKTHDTSEDEDPYEWMTYHYPDYND